MITLLLGLSLAADCPQVAASTDLSRAIADAEATIASLDIAAFKEATDRLDALLPCLGDPITRAVAAKVHRFKGIRAFADRDLEAATAMFRAGRMLEPDYRFPTTLIPEGNPIRSAYEGVAIEESPTFDTLPTPAEGGYLQFDGRTTNQRPRDWATLYQRFDGKGGMKQTDYLMPSAAVPQYAVQVGEVVVPIPYVDPVFVDKKPVGLLGATVAAAVTTGLLYGMAGGAYAQYKNPNTPDERLDSAADRANALVIASAITGTATLGLGVGVALRW